jgi:hypothetical protein
MRLTLRVSILFVLVTLLILTALPLTFAAPQGTATSQRQPAIDLDDLIAETQKTVRGTDHTGLVWWIPVEFWEASGAGSTDQLKPLRNYTMVVAAVGQVSGLAGITWVERSELQSNLIVRDSKGREVSSIRTTPRDLQLLTEILQLFFRQELGEMGKNVHIFYFPAVDSDGAPLADPRKAGNMVAMIRKIAGRDQAFEWKLPLTSLTPPKFCPTGGERVEASWKYCPWHGTDLTAQPAR